MFKLIVLIFWKILWLPVFYITNILEGDNPFEYAFYMVVNTHGVRLQVTPWLGVLMSIGLWYALIKLYTWVKRKYRSSRDIVDHLIE